MGERRLSNWLESLQESLYPGVQGSVAGGTVTTGPRDTECDEGRKRKRTKSKPDTEGIFYNLKREGLAAIMLLNPATGSFHFCTAQVNTIH